VTRRTLGTVVLTGVLLCGSITPALGAETLGYSSLTPANGASFPASPSRYGLPWMMTGARPQMSLSVRVSTTPDLGSDGATLSDLHQVDYFAMAESSTDAGVYRGVSNGGSSRWTNVPGTYYWQVEANWSEYQADPPKYTSHYAVTPVFTIAIQAPLQTSPPVAPQPPQTAPVATAPHRAHHRRHHKRHVRRHHRRRR
jgi:hypothetical protein